MRNALINEILAGGRIINKQVKLNETVVVMNANLRKKEQQKNDYEFVSGDVTGEDYGYGKKGVKQGD
jgi:hypothetical protein